MSRTEIRSSSMRWIDLVHPSEAELIALGEEFHFHPLDIADCRKRGQRQKVERYHGYAFLVFLVPVYNRATREIEPGEIDFFIGSDFVVTVQEQALPQVASLRHQFEHDELLRERTGASCIAMVHEAIDRLIVSIYPMLDHVSIDIHEAQKSVFAGKEKAMVAEIAFLRRNVTDFRRIVQSHKNTLKRLVDILELNGLPDAREHIPVFQRTIDRTKEIWDLLESYRESIATIYETNESLISFKLNDIMRTFTTMSVIIFVMTLTATVLGIRAHGSPLLETRHGFWIIATIVLLTGLLARVFFKKRRLLE